MYDRCCTERSIVYPMTYEAIGNRDAFYVLESQAHQYHTFKHGWVKDINSARRYATYSGAQDVCDEELGERIIEVTVREIL